MSTNHNNTTTTIDAEKSQKKSNEQAKTAILDFLRKLGIEKIIYVDDRCSIQELRESFIGKLKQKYSIKPEELDFVNWDEPQQMFDRNIEDLWDSSNEQEKRDLFLKILHYEDNIDEIENSTAPLNLKNHLNDKIELVSPLEWEERKEQIIGELNQNKKVLFLFDVEFEHAPLPSNRNGLHLASELLNNQEVKDYVYCGIFSHIFTVDEEYSKRNEYHKSENFEKNRFYTISKKRFQDNSYLPGLAEGIRNTLLIDEVEFLKNESSDLLQKSFNASLTEIENLTPDSFNHVIQKSSRKEGIWEMATLIRINNIITKDKALNTLLCHIKRTKINKSLEKIRGVEGIKTGGETPFDKTQIQKLRNKELYIESSILNQLHFPISNGDIFEISGKKYILLAQPCNLAMRNKGVRNIGRNKVYETGFLLEIENLTKEQFEKQKTGPIALIENTDIESTIFPIIRFPMFQTVSLSPLDLTVFNEDGKATLNLNNTCNNSSTIQESWKLRYKKLHEEFTAYKNNISIFKKLKSADKDSLKNLVYCGEIFKNYDINNENVLNTSTNTLSFDIQRVSFYREPYSNDLLQQFMQYLSRNAFDRNFMDD